MKLTALILIGFAVGMVPAPSVASASLHAGKASLTITGGETEAQSLSITLAGPDGVTWKFQQATPLAVELLNAVGETKWFQVGYTSQVALGNSIRGLGEIRTPAGTVFTFEDTYSPAATGNAFDLARVVTVRNPATNDVGFLTRFSLHRPSSPALPRQEMFIPGICYRQNRHVPPHALAADFSEKHILVREDRMPLPLVMLRDPADGVTATLIHLQPDGATCQADYATGPVVDARLQFASLGVQGESDPALTFLYPGTEGSRTYIRPPGRRRQTTGWSERFHPVQAGIQHSYQVRIDLSAQPDFSSAMRQAWRTAFAQLRPPVARTDIAASYEASIRLIADWAQTRNGYPGLPFRLRLPEGRLEGDEHINYQMGFVGQQLPLAYHLLRYGLQHQDEVIIKKGEAMVDFWATNSLTPAGLPRTWFNVYPQPHWRAYNTFLRVASDGMVGALQAWDVMGQHGRSKPSWIRFCRGFGDWLVNHQNPDGSWYREYSWDNKAVNEGKQNTTHPIRFLVDLSKATKERKYLDAAIRAGDYCWPAVHEAFAYVGGTADNPNVMDKEAGFMAMDAFLALHDVTGDSRWLKAAAQAADFTETWAYCWNIPVPVDDPAASFPNGATTTGFSIIATGHSGADLFLAGAPFLYYRLYLQTGDAHYADIARQLLYDTKQSMDINGSLGYGHTGLCTEALSLAPPRGRGVNTWLPWLTYSMINPIANLQDAYDLSDTPQVVEAKMAELRMRDRAFGKTRGLFTARAK